jgi:hypothetical protein
LKVEDILFPAAFFGTIALCILQMRHVEKQEKRDAEEAARDAASNVVRLPLRPPKSRG